MTEEELQSQIKYGESEFRFTTHDSGGKKEDKNRGEYQERHLKNCKYE